MRTGNSLLDALPANEAEVVHSYMDWTELERDAVLIEIGQDSGRFYFPVSGLVSCAVSTAGGHQVEVHSAGVRDVVGLPWTAKQPWRATVQVRGSAAAVESRVLRPLLPSLENLRDILFGYLSGLVADVARRAVCARFHASAPRVCFWLTQAAAVAKTLDLECTQQCIADAVGAQRATVTVILGDLQRRAVIRCGRSHVVILDLSALRSMACECVSQVNGF